MADIRDSLTLDIAAALASVSELEQALNRAVGVVEVNVDTAAAQAEIDGLSQETVQVALDVDTGTAEGEIDALGGVVPAQIDLDTSAAIAATEAVSEALETAASATVDLDTSGAQQEIGALGQALEGAASATGEVSTGIGGIGDEASQALPSLGLLATSLRGASTSAVGLGAIAAGGFGLVQGAQALNATVDAASDLAESVNAVTVVFGEASDSVLAFTGDTSDAVFAAQADLNQLATVLGSLLTGVGLSSQEAAEGTRTLIGLSADLASVFNDDVAVAAERVAALLRGETEPIRQYGINISAAEAQARALADGLIAAGEPLDEQAKLLATLNILLEDTALIQGDAARTADAYANKGRAIGEALAEVKTELGEGLLPAFEAFQELLFGAITVAGDVAEAIGNISSAGQEATLRLASFFGGIPGVYAEVEAATFRVNQATEAGIPVIEAWIAEFEGIKGASSSGADLAIVINSIREQAGLTRAETVELTEALLAQAVAFGLPADAISEITRELKIAQAEIAATDAAVARSSTADAIAARAESYAAFFAGITEATTGLTDPVLGAIDATLRLRDAFADARADGAITADEFGELADASFEAREALLLLSQGDITAGIAALAETLGLAPEAVRATLTELGILDGTTVNIDVDSMISDLDGVAGAAVDARTEYEKFRASVRESVDPIFAAVQAQQRLDDLLVRIDEDGNRTNDELIDLAAASLDVRESLLGLGDGDTARGLELIAEALGISTDAARELLAAGIDLTNTPIDVRFEIENTELEQQIAQYKETALNIPVNFIPGGGGVQEFGGGIIGGGGGGGVIPHPGGGGFQEFGGTTVIIQNPTTGNIEAGASQAANVLTNTRQFLP
ncbi:MAG TPA: hypothetical protein VGC11_03840 [Acidimicrobiia bacterium]